MSAPPIIPAVSDRPLEEKGLVERLNREEMNVLRQIRKLANSLAVNTVESPEADLTLDPTTDLALVDASGSPVAVTLAAAAVWMKDVTVQKVDASTNHVVVTGATSGAVTLAAQWDSATFTSDGTLIYAKAATQSAILLAGDVTGGAGANTVAKIQTITVAMGTPNTGDFLYYDGSAIVSVNTKDRVLDTTYSPVGLWTMQNAGGADFTAGGAVDTSGNGHNMTLEAGTLRYTYLTTELAGFYFDGATDLYVSSFVSALAITGDMTFLCIASDAPPTATLGTLVEHGDAGTDSDPNNNTLYGIFGVASPSPGKTYLHEQGAGVNETKTTANWPMPYSANLVGFSRISNVVQLYANGRVWDTPSGTLNAPTGGSNGKLRLGGRSVAGGYYTGGMCSVAIYGAGLSAAQHLERYNYCFGRSRGRKA